MGGGGVLEEALCSPPVETTRDISRKASMHICTFLSDKSVLSHVPGVNVTHHLICSSLAAPRCPRLCSAFIPVSPADIRQSLR